MRNSGKPSEVIFEARYRKHGKKCHVYRLRDMSDFFGMNGGRKVKMPPLPCDYIVTHDGNTIWAEVKSTQDPRAFRLAMLSKDQWAAAVKITKAGGSYLVHVHHLLTDSWYRVPFSLCLLTRDAGFSSLKWHELEGMKWL